MTTVSEIQKVINVNTIEFNGRKAVINSYDIDKYPVLAKSMNEQLAEWKANFPNAKVQNERMHDLEVVGLVRRNKADGGLYRAWEIGQSSKA